MRILLTGANGFIGCHLAAAMTAAGHEVVCAVRAPRADPRLRDYAAVPIDMARDVAPEAWRWKLEGIDAVVNCAGILRQSRRQRFEDVHVAAPLALARACVQAGIRRFVQISALGDPADGEFIASKHRFDQALAAQDLDYVVLRPALVYSTRGSYGGTSLLRAIAAFPLLLPLPGRGEQRVQPLAMEDLGLAVSAAVARSEPVRQVIELGGPETLTLAAYLRSWRAWLAIPPAREWKTPDWLVRAGAWLGEHFGSGPLGLTMLRMLERGNVTAADATARAEALLGVRTRSLAQALQAAPSQVQDRWHARLYLLAPVLVAALALLWLASGVVGLITPLEALDSMFSGTRMSPTVALWLTVTGSVADLALGAMLLLGWRRSVALKAMFAVTFAYTLVLGALVPRLWLEPLGGLLKNLVLLPATLAASVLDEGR